jgi:transcription elongation GreA/GreB family factor
VRGSHQAQKFAAKGAPRQTRGGPDWEGLGVTSPHPPLAKPAARCLTGSVPVALGAEHLGLVVFSVTTQRAKERPSEDLRELSTTVLELTRTPMAHIDKRQLHERLKQKLESELQKAQKRAKDAAEGATHEENRAEGDKDMRATEASYVARGQAGRVSEMEEALARVSALALIDFDDQTRIAISALVELEHRGKRLHYFLVPAAGGERIDMQGVEVQTLTTQSPLGRALLGCSVGDEAELPPRGPGEQARVYEIISAR